MPIYEYRCGDCGHQKDHLQKHSDAPIAACPACGSASYTKQLTAAGFQLKGSGWYATDFKGSASSSAKSEAACPAAPDAPPPPCAGSCACH
ncbi:MULTISPECIES: FmdB family zinc ribbon protein [Uliginosibacterium]|uniref:Zinc ribbon domain-containing protein n=1 Tax=Uliginosibacterium aquaticum TaxID=2731212 RepID=A0ABX2IF62_9RHOO|nr:MULTISPECIES: zinc ribbon domain-containing protein [Uliginosibacterium]MDO6385018.1 zinc ribbon domain-containing protein [Uliginosibacterium sp. 31-12]NSL55278.1 zinc ribbon domain-containing protein [Uliginosibacterium aquaticum]PLK48700.1 FmdB family transcriptional regulator [Uliginosibacterium sp. TH139]